MERRLAAILAADVVGYCRLMGANEVGTLADLREIRTELIEGTIAREGGRIVKLMGDGILAEFGSVVGALKSALAIQEASRRRCINVPEDRRIQFRIGVNLGDVVVEDGDIFGDGVNIAARIEALARPGGIAVTGAVRDQVGNRLDIDFEPAGEPSLKNIETTVSVFHVGAQKATTFQTVGQKLVSRPSIAVLPFINMSGDPEQEYFADGITEDLITDLSNLSGLFVVGRNSAFIYRGRRSIYKMSPANWASATFSRAAFARRDSVWHRRAADRWRERRTPLGRALPPRSLGHLRASGRNHQNHHRPVAG